MLTLNKSKLTLLNLLIKTSLQIKKTKKKKWYFDLKVDLNLGCPQMRSWAINLGLGLWAYKKKQECFIDSHKIQ